MTNNEKLQQAAEKALKYRREYELLGQTREYFIEDYCLSGMILDSMSAKVAYKTIGNVSTMLYVPPSVN